MMMNIKYCNSLIKYSRFKTREVKVGETPLGGKFPIRIQSMATTNTMDTIATVEQSIRMIEAGCEYVRITAPSINEAENLANIKKELRKRGYKTPLIADIHFTPNAAETAARIVEKVRVNPGNYADKKKFQKIEYTDAEYQSEIERIYARFSPLVKICKQEGTAIRIGTNHGSLSDRIMSRHGDTPHGMVESALEFVRVCEDLGYFELVLSMKASNPQVMVQAYRLLVSKMIESGRNYPLHIGVTEAGEGEDGRIKSAIGIGSLLEDGLGDTVRVSLTEEPEFEAPVAKKLVERYHNRENHDTIPEIKINPINPFIYDKRSTNNVLNIGGKHAPVVITDFCIKKSITRNNLSDLGYFYNEETDKWVIKDTACDYLFVGDKKIDFEIPGTLGIIQNYKTWRKNKSKERHYPFLNVKEYLQQTDLSDHLNFIYLTFPDFNSQLIQKLKVDFTAVLLIDTYNQHGVAEQRRLFIELMEQDCKTPVIIGRAYSNLDVETLQLYAASDLGSLMIDGLGDGIFIAAENCGNDKEINSLAFGILQATRTRISRTEYISCPSCGRTLFDLQETTAKIRHRTNHLKGVKIAIMGCIVNGPGEMADADYGYVGTGPGKITLYRGKEVVKKNVPSAFAVDELINLIQKDGCWIEPSFETEKELIH